MFKFIKNIVSLKKGFSAVKEKLSSFIVKNKVNGMRSFAGNSTRTIESVSTVKTNNSIFKNLFLFGFSYLEKILIKTTNIIKKALIGEYQYILVPVSIGQAPVYNDALQFTKGYKNGKENVNRYSTSRRNKSSYTKQ